MLINSVKDVALALNNLINVTKSASGKTIDHPDMKKLKETAKTMVTNVTSLLRTVKIVEDKTHRGTHALEITMESIDQELHNYNHRSYSTNQVTPEDLIRVTKQVSLFQWTFLFSLSSRFLFVVYEWLPFIGYVCQ
jgi:talin